MELRTALEARLGTAVPLAAVTETLTLDGLARRIAEAVRATPAEAEAAALHRGPRARAAARRRHRGGRHHGRRGVTAQRFGLSAAVPRARCCNA